MLQREAPEYPATMRQARDLHAGRHHLAHAGGAYPHLDSADAWWAALEPVFVDAYLGVGLETKRAHAAGQARAAPPYLDLARWRLAMRTPRRQQER